MHRRRRAILHIGTAKTGSTTIQEALAGSRDLLLARGFAFPHSPGRRNHLHLAVFSADDAQAAEHARALGETGSIDAIRRRIAAALAAEIDALPGSVHSLILSSEALSDNVTSAEGLARLKALLDTWCDEYRVLVYLRRQDEFAVSLYSTLLRGGATDTDLLPPAAAQDRFDWAAMLDRWGAAFGEAALAPRLFERAALLGGDLLTDLQAALGLPPLPVPEAARTLNPSLLPQAQEFLRRLNLAALGLGPAATAPADAAGKVPSFIRHYLSTAFAGTGRQPARAAAEAFVARHAVGNEWIRARFFPGRPTLFSTDFSRYPEEPDPLPDGDAVAAVGIAVALAQAAQLTGLQADVAARRGRDRMAQAPEEARSRFRRALGLVPGHLVALRGLLDLAADADQREEAAQRLAQAIAAEPDRPELRALLRRQGAPAVRDGDRQGVAASRDGDRQGAAALRDGDRQGALEMRDGGQPGAAVRDGDPHRRPAPPRTPEERAARRASRTPAPGSDPAERPHLDEAARAARRARRAERLRSRGA